MSLRAFGGHCTYGLQVEHFAQFLVGKDVNNIAALWQEMYRSQCVLVLQCLHVYIMCKICGCRSICRSSRHCILSIFSSSCNSESLVFSMR